MTRLLHTADWHLGARLVDNERLPEQAAFLDWLLVRIAELRPDMLVVAGDIFDTANPPQQALALYYNFLVRLAALRPPCQVLILGGNHDSPATLNAPRELLKSISVTVVGEAPHNPEEALIEFPDAVLCAVPYLRERDVRNAVAGQSFDEVASGIREGVRAHYGAVREAGLRRAAGRPLIGTGHLTVAGSLGSDSERSIHVGNLGAVGSDCFVGFAYVALGHIHKPQAADPAGRVRYPGSPIPLSFSEVGVAKELRLIDVVAGGLELGVEIIPEFRPLLRVSTRLDGIQSVLSQVQGGQGAAFEPWLELTVTDGAEYPDLDRLVREAARELRLRVLKVLVPRPAGQGAFPGGSGAEAPSLDSLRPAEVFEARLRQEGIRPEDEAWVRLRGTFEELLGSLHDSKEGGA
jgi:exonuclease SbcD